MWTQFFGALNDNILKNALVVLLAFRGIALWGLHAESLVSLATLIFILPFFLFSALAGQIADKVEKSKLIRWIKLAEILIMVVAGFGFYFAHYPILFLALFLMGLHSAFFGPVKYSALPELMPTEKLTSANAYVEVGTFVAILMGTIGGGYLVSFSGGEYYLIAILFINSLIGYFLSRGIHKIKIADPNLVIQLNPIPPVISTIKGSYKNKTVFNSILGISWFWLLGAVVLTLLPIITTQILKGNEHTVTLFLAAFTIGIAVGSIICDRLSFNRIEIGLVPFGSLGMSIFLLDLASVLHGWPSGNHLEVNDFLSSENSFRILIDLFCIAIFGGIFTVPLYTLIQEKSDPKQRSRIIGANNIINSFFMVIGSAVLMWFLQNKMSLPLILALLAFANLVVAMYIYTLVPEFTLRFLAWILTHCLYRLRVQGENHIPKEGPAILVSNHVSYIDWLIIAAGIKRPICFVMYYKFARIPLMRYLIKSAGVIPIAGKSEDPKIFEEAFLKIADNLNQGNLVCIFPEGSLTKDGEIHEFKKGIEHVIAKNPVPVIPMSLTGLWGSVFSHYKLKGASKVPRRIWFPVRLSIGELIEPAQVTASNLELKVRKLYG